MTANNKIRVTNDTLDHIVEAIGGEVISFFEGRKPRVRFILDDINLEADNNTALLVAVLWHYKNQGDCDVTEW